MGLNGATFSTLLESRQRKLKNRSIRAIVLNEHADEEARLEMFDRINTGSMIAQKAEIRRGVHAGPFIDLVIQLSVEPLLVDLTPMSDMREKLREREELITRFFAYGDGLDDYRDDPTAFLDRYSKRMNEAIVEEPGLADNLRSRLHRTLSVVDRISPYGFARSVRARATPRARFEALAIGTWQALQQDPTLEQDPPVHPQWLDSESFRRAVGSDGANVRKKLLRRIAFVRERLLERAS